LKKKYIVLKDVKKIACHHILLRKKIHCPERCKKNIMSPHLIEKKKYIVLKDVKKKKIKKI
jgi:hypothetical protein